MTCSSIRKADTLVISIAIPVRRRCVPSVTKFHQSSDDIRGTYKEELWLFITWGTRASPFGLYHLSNCTTSEKSWKCQDESELE